MSSGTSKIISTTAWIFSWDHRKNTWLRGVKKMKIWEITKYFFGENSKKHIILELFLNFFIILHWTGSFSQNTYTQGFHLHNFQIHSEQKKFFLRRVWKWDENFLYLSVPKFFFILFKKVNILIPYFFAGISIEKVYRKKASINTI